MAEDKMRDVVYGLALESHEKEQEIQRLKEQIRELERQTPDGAIRDKEGKVVGRMDGHFPENAELTWDEEELITYQEWTELKVSQYPSIK